MNGPVVLLEDGTLRSGGIRRYQDEIIRRLDASRHAHLVVSSRKDRPVPPGVDFMHVPAPRFLSWHRWVPRALSAARGRRPKLIHLLTQAAVMPASGDPPIVMTVHDLAPLVVGIDPWRWAWFRWAILPTLRRIAHVVTDSNTVADSVRSLARMSPDDVSVVQPGVGPPFTDHVGELPDGKHVLVVGAGSRRKGADIVGRATFTKPVVMAGRHVRSTGGGRRVVASPSDDELVQLYRDAACVVIPSRYEGFGLPALEAMACGAPVVAARGGALAETVGSAGILVPHCDPVALGNAVNGLLEDVAEHQALRERGRRWAASWTWERSMEGLDRIWERYS